MTRFLSRLYRRLRHGRPIVVVSGLPRSGTSMMMRMLGAGGIELATDGVRGADPSNPAGYFELERVKTLEDEGEHAWLAGCRGRTVKIISHLLPFLPEDHNYRVVFMERDVGEVIASQNAMLEARGEPGGPESPTLAGQLEEHRRRVRLLLRRRSCFEVLEVGYHEVLADPLAAAERVGRFLGGGLDARAMAEAVDRSLHRQRG